MNSFPKRLLSLASGRYSGEGVNHDQEPFVGLLQLRYLIGEAGLGLTFTATGVGGEVYHEEETLLAPGPTGELVLATLNSNDPSLRTYELRREDSEGESEHTYVFGTGDPSAGDTFRCEISLDLHENGDLGYRYAWGVPGGEFAERSSVRMRKERHER
ncbi:MAG: hypothetical protein JKY65_01620 [Planctomycetes bacterium]|nr:hypothetical protein [Planctomycetota bacterium]